MTRLVVVADDLTGALDASAPFAARGITTVVALGLDGLGAALSSRADVVGVSTDSREIAPDAARDAVAACMARLPPGVPVLKKVDSRLKGHIATELDAIAFRSALVMPAIPAFGRWVRGGKVGGFGVAEPIAVADKLGRHAGAATIPDVDTQTDIDRALSGGAYDLLVGARGLAEAMAQRMAPDAPAQRAYPLASPAYCIIGSTDPITQVQIQRLRAAAPDLAYIAAPDGKMAAVPNTASVTVLQATCGEGADAATVARRLGEALVRLKPPSGAVLVVSGGATAQVVLRTLGIAVLDLLGEALPGLPIAQAGGFTIITKSGGFGYPDTLMQLLGQLGHSDRESCG